MATQSRKTGSHSKKKAVAAKRTTSRKNTARKTAGSRQKTISRKQTISRGLKLEIFVLVILLFSILLLIGNFGAGGTIGDTVSKWSFGLIGWIAYLFPFFLFFTMAFVAVNKENSLMGKKVIGLLLAFVCLCSLIHLFTLGYIKGDTILGYYKYCSVQKTGGGVLGGSIVRMLTIGFGKIGAYVILFVVLLIAIILITQHSILKPLKNRSKQLYQKQKKLHDQKQIQKPETARTARTVNFPDLTLKQKNKTEKKEPKDDFLEKQPVEDNLFQPQLDEDIFSIDFSQEESTVVPEKEQKHTKNPRSSKEEITQGIETIQTEIDEKEEIQKDQYQYPPIHLLKRGERKKNDNMEHHVQETAAKLKATLDSFGVNVTISDVSCGPTVTRYELQPEQGVKVSKIVNLTDDIKLNLAAADIRIEAPIPGKAAVGIEVPNKTNSAVMLRDLLESEAFRQFPSQLAFAVGKDIAGKPVVADIGKMPHLLIAGATGSGKSVCINTLIMSILYKSTPEEVKLIMIDPKVVELSVYNGIPHLFIPVVTDPKKAAGALNWAVAEMTERYNLFAQYNVRDLKGYNKKVEQLKDIEDEKKPKKLPKIVIIVDELADLMMVAPGEVEDSICRLAQLARAAGIHLIIATQRPSVNVITGLIKANMPSRIAFSVSSGVDSRTILDMNGAEKLLGRGDMLYYPQGYQKPARLQGAFVSDSEVSQVVSFLKENQKEAPVYDEKITEMISNGSSMGEKSTSDDVDAYFIDAGKCIIEKDKASIGMLQRVFKIGFNRAARIMDQLSRVGVVGPEEGTKPRKILMTMEEFEKYIEESM